MSPPPLLGIRILGVFPHPDDEAYSLAGTLGWWVQEGAELHLLYATLGERGVDRSGKVSSGEALGQARRGELEAASARLQAAGLHLLGFRDGHLAAQVPELETALSKAILRLKPQVVVSLGPDGAYGHMDHLALFEALEGALDHLEASSPRSM